MEVSAEQIFFEFEKNLIHNFVNPHMQLKYLTPAEKAEICFELGRNKFLELIKKQALKKHHSLR